MYLNLTIFNNIFMFFKIYCKYVYVFIYPLFKKINNYDIKYNRFIYRNYFFKINLSKTH